MTRKPKPIKSKLKPASPPVTQPTVPPPAPQPLTTRQAYQRAEQYFKAGRLSDAERLSRQILEVEPRYANALHLLGVIAAQMGQLEEAEQWFLTALEYNPTVSHYHNSLANVYRLQNKPELAETHWQHAKGAGHPTWVKNFDTLTAETVIQMQQCLKQWSSPPLISVLMPTYNSQEEWLRAVIESVINQLYPHWELCIADDASTLPHVRQILAEYVKRDSRIKVYYRPVNGHISAASNSALALVEGDYIALLDHDDLLPPHALYWVAGEIHTHPQVCLLYSDEDKINDRGERFSPYFKCDWNPDLFLSHNLVTHLGVYKTSLVRDLGGFREGYEGAQDYDLALRLVERLKPYHIRHIPHILYHWRSHSHSTALHPEAKPYAIEAAQKAIREHLTRLGKTAQVMESYRCPWMLRVRYALPPAPPLVSLIIPTRNRVDLLRVCVGSILEKTDYPHFEILIVDNQSDDPATLIYLQQLQKNALVRVISYPHPFNYAALNNFAVEQAKGDLIGLLNNDIEVINDSWLSEMVSHAIRPEIGAVGARLLYPNNSLQHGGVILGIGGVAGHSHKHLSRKDAGYFGRAQLIQNLSAVTAACMVMRKEVFISVGGFNSVELTVAFNDVDLCLKIREQGWRILWTPYAELYHYESASRGYEDNPEKKARFAAEVRYMKTRWGDSLLQDPAYSPNLTLNTENFAIAWPPRVLLNETFEGYLSKLLPSSAKPKIAFLHIPKTAGTSLRHLIEQEYPRQECLSLYEEALYMLGNSDKEVAKNFFQKRLSAAKVLYGHFPFGIHKTLEISCRYVTFLRHPVDLSVSLYNHAANDPHSPFYADIQGGMSLLEILSTEKWRYNNNSMTRIMTGRVRNAEGIPTCEDLSIFEETLEIIENHFLLIGLTERFSEAVTALGNYLGWATHYPIPVLNVTVSKRVHHLDTQTREAIEAYNRLDVKLHEYFRKMRKGYFVNEKFV